jgi:hypothetical protein
MIKRHFYISLLLLLALLCIPFIVHARLGIDSFGIGTRGLGARVLTTGIQSSAVITCAATYGPLFTAPVVAAPPGPYFISLGTNGAPRSGGWILANYSIVPNFGTCYNTQTGFPIPAFSLNPYGVSR